MVHEFHDNEQSKLNEHIVIFFYKSEITGNEIFYIYIKNTSKYEKPYLHVYSKHIYISLKLFHNKKIETLLHQHDEKMY